MKAIVTGAAGFIGYHLSLKLLQEHISVIGVDVLTDYYDPGLKRSHIWELSKDKGFTFVERDLSKGLDEAQLEGVDYVFHLAGQPGVRSCWGDSFSEYTSHNVNATQRLLESIVRSGRRTPKFIYASTSSVYGDQQAEAVNEETLPAPMSPYAVTKLAGEHLVRLYGKEYGLESVILRYFSVYGPDQRPDMAFSKLCRALYEGAEFTLYGNGEQSRDFTYVGDIVQGTLLAAKRGVPGQIYNLGCGRGVTMKDAVANLERLAGRSLAARMEPLQPGEMKQTLADISKAVRELGYKPNTQLEEGLALQWEAYVKEQPTGTGAGTGVGGSSR